MVGLNRILLTTDPGVAKSRRGAVLVTEFMAAVVLMAAAASVVGPLVRLCRDEDDRMRRRTIETIRVRNAVERLEGLTGESLQQAVAAAGVDVQIRIDPFEHQLGRGRHLTIHSVREPAVVRHLWRLDP